MSFPFPSATFTSLRIKNYHMQFVFVSVSIIDRVVWRVLGYLCRSMGAEWACDREGRKLNKTNGLIALEIASNVL